MGSELPDVRVSEVALTVADLAAAREFYEGRLGFAVVEGESDEVLLGAGGSPFLRLVHDPRAVPPGQAARLYHFAVLYPSRRDLAGAVARVARSGWPLQGASDHLVSEAVYLADPEDNGIELYRDRPRHEWRTRNGEVEMATLPLDVRGLLAEAPPNPERAPAGTRIGHIHLHVGDLEEAERFYRDVVGLEVMARYGPSASFLAAGGYHHHVGINIWGTAGAGPAEDGRLGLRWYRLAVPDGAALSALAARLDAHGHAPERGPGGALRFRDPSGHRIVAAAD